MGVVALRSAFFLRVQSFWIGSISPLFITGARFLSYLFCFSTISRIYIYRNLSFSPQANANALTKKVFRSLKLLHCTV